MNRKFETPVFRGYQFIKLLSARSLTCTLLKFCQKAHLVKINLNFRLLLNLEFGSILHLWSGGLDQINPKAPRNTLSTPISAKSCKNAKSNLICILDSPELFFIEGWCEIFLKKFGRCFSKFGVFRYLNVLMSASIG